MSQILGEYRHTLDEKNRTFLPSKIRSDIGSEYVLTRGLDKCLTLYPIESWQKFDAKIEALPSIKAKAVRRWIYGFSQSGTVDKQGRILIPSAYVEYAGLGTNIVTLGVGDHIEIWSEEEFEKTVKGMDAAEIEEILIDMGM